MPTHRMHLKGPWEYQVLIDADAPTPRGDSPVAQNALAPNSLVSASGTVRMPSTWQELLGDYRGSVRFERRFHKPTNLDESEKVFVVFDGIGGNASVALNDQALGEIPESHTTAEFEITPLLQQTNRLQVEIHFGPSIAHSTPGGLWGPVALEIRSP